MKIFISLATSSNRLNWLFDSLWKGVRRLRTAKLPHAVHFLCGRNHTTHNPHHSNGWLKFKIQTSRIFCRLLFQYFPRCPGLPLFPRACLWISSQSHQLLLILMRLWFRRPTSGPPVGIFFRWSLIVVRSSSVCARAFFTSWVVFRRRMMCSFSQHHTKTTETRLSTKLRRMSGAAEGSFETHAFLPLDTPSKI